MSDPLDRLARAARALYVFHRRLHEERATGVKSRYNPGPAFDGGRDRAGRQCRPVWPKVAAVAVAQGADLAEFVAAQFAADRPPPQPNQLLGPAAVERYRAAAGDAARAARRRLETHHDQFVLAVAREMSRAGAGDRAAAARVVLADATVPLSALYRYCVAARTHEDGVAAAWRDRAVAQYLSGSAGYRAGWGDFVPEGLVREAEAVRATLMGGGGA